jgi:hypothetical protein
VVEAWLSDVYPRIKERARGENGVILWQDDPGAAREAVPQAGYDSILTPQGRLRRWVGERAERTELLPALRQPRT